MVPWSLGNPTGFDALALRPQSCLHGPVPVLLEDQVVIISSWKASQDEATKLLDLTQVAA